MTQSIPAHWKKVMDAESIERAVARISYQILEKHQDLSSVAIVGVRTAGAHLATRIRNQISSICGSELPLGAIDISLYRDDWTGPAPREFPALHATEIPFSVMGSKIILVDDIFFTGRTIRAAIDAIMDLGRPDLIELAVLIDRGYRQLPIRPDYVGRNFASARSDMVKIRLSESGYQDGAYLVHHRAPAGN